jgi:DNA-binding transcriptional LysR family regulator
MADISQMILLPLLWERLHHLAPNIRIEIFPLTNSIGVQLANGDVDFALGYVPDLVTGIYQRILFKQNFVCLVGRNHPRISDQLSLEEYEAESHAVISASGGAPAIVDKEIDKQKINRRIALHIPNFLGAAFVAEHTDLVLTIPSRLGNLIVERGQFKIFPVPFELPSYEVKLHWHERFHYDEGSRWLRRLISDLMIDNDGDV